MTHEEAVTICRVISESCMWGHSGIASVIIDELEESLPGHDWHGNYKTHKRSAKYEAVGVIRTQDEFDAFMDARKQNWESRPHLSYSNPDELEIHGGKGEGLLKYVLGPLARELSEEHDPHNFEVLRLREQRGEVEYDSDD